MIHTNIFVDPFMKYYVADGCNNNIILDKWTSNPYLQFERFGYMVVDTDTNVLLDTGEGKPVFSCTVRLK